MTFPRLNVKVREGPGYGQATLENITMPEFKAPSFSYQLQPDDEILWFSSGGSVKIQGLWEAWYKVLIKAKLSGAISATAKDLNLQLHSRISQPRPGALPIVNITHCSADIGDLDLSIAGGVVQWFVNLFRHPIANKVKTVLEAQICTAATGVLQVYFQLLFHCQLRPDLVSTWRMRKSKRCRR